MNRKAPKYIDHLVLADFCIVVSAHNPNVLTIVIVSIEDFDVVGAKPMSIGYVAAAIGNPYILASVSAISFDGMHQWHLHPHSHWSLVE